MPEAITYLLIALNAATLIMLVCLLSRTKGQDQSSLFKEVLQNLERTERALKDEIIRARDESTTNGKYLREELTKNLNAFNESLLNRLNESTRLQLDQLQGLLQNTDNRLRNLQEDNNTKLEAVKINTEEKLSQMDRQMREELGNSLKAFSESLLNSLGNTTRLQMDQLDAFAKQLQALTQSNEEKMEKIRVTVEEKIKSFQENNSSINELLLNKLQGLLQNNDTRLKELQGENSNKIDTMRISTEEKLNSMSKQIREELGSSLKSFNDSLQNSLGNNNRSQIAQLESFSNQLKSMTERNEEKLEKMRTTVEAKMTSIQENNTKQLEQMRLTVDEKLQNTLENRLGQSFKMVSERLEQVHKGIGEMQALASNVGDLKRIMSNVKTRGIWGEIQLGNLLEQIFTVEQYEQNVATKPGSNDRVEFAIKLPGSKEDGPIMLPIDSKFPQEDYQRLLDAQEEANCELAENASKALESRIKEEAKTICSKYIHAPYTTDFAILFLPIEGLYAEVLRRPGLYDNLMREYRVVICGPTTLTAFLNSLQMGFRTLAIQKRSSEVWSLLGAIKTEFGTFGGLLEKTNKKLQETSNVISKAAVRSRAIERKLKDVQELPKEEANELLSLGEALEIAATEDE